MRQMKYLFFKNSRSWYPAFPRGTITVLFYAIPGRNTCAGCISRDVPKLKAVSQSCPEGPLSQAGLEVFQAGGVGLLELVLELK